MKGIASFGLSLVAALVLLAPAGEIEPAGGGESRRFEGLLKEAEGLYARCLQHESDHLDGMTVVNRMGAAAKIASRRQLKKLTERAQGD